MKAMMVLFFLKSVHSLVVYGWVLLGALYIGSAPFTRKTGVREPLSQRLPHLLGGVTGLILLFSSRSFPKPLDLVFYQENATTVAAGLLMCLIGWTIAVWARLQLSENWSAWVAVRQGHTLIEQGPYAIVRHPIYSGLLLAAFGTAIVQGPVRCFLGVLVIGITYHFKARSEERLMRRSFGDAYEAYSARTGSIVPRLR